MKLRGSFVDLRFPREPKNPGPRSPLIQQKWGSEADIFNSIRDAVYKPIHLSLGGLTMLRTDNSPTGRPFGGWGLFFIQDDVAKIGQLLNNSGGTIDRKQVLEPFRLKESLFRTADPLSVGLHVPWSENPSVQDAYRYHNYFWARHMTPAEFPQYHCDFWVPLMSGYGGNSVLLLPNRSEPRVIADFQGPVQCCNRTDPRNRLQPSQPLPQQRIMFERANECSIQALPSLDMFAAKPEQRSDAVADLLVGRNEFTEIAHLM